MRIIGITGGVGAGKSEILSYIGNNYNCEIILADEVAHKVREPGESCFDELVELLGAEVLTTEGQIDRRKMADKIFSNENILKSVNALIHPAVKDYIKEAIERSRQEAKLDFLFIEAALLIEDGYENIVDELWYIYTEESERRRRLKQARNYSDEKITGILNKQLSESEYRKHCRVVIDNSRKLQYTYEQIDKKLEEYLWQREKNT